jgi:glyoxylase-like metal-dependent hydrolase (beta-lactamase superfamily II)
MEIAPRIHLIDVEYLGQRQAIAACALETDDGVAIIDPGPASSLAGLERGLGDAGFSLDDVSALLLTHIHLDHAGATGTLVRDHPSLRVHVHARGAPHLIDPSRLMASALRIYGDSLGRLFGEFLPVPAERINVLDGDETLDVAGRLVRVKYAPGHAWHHVAYLDEETGTAFLGDTAGERFAPSRHVLPVTPPPDIDMEAWRETIRRIREWRAASLVVTHFGAFDDVSDHLDALERGLEDWAERVRRSLRNGADDDECATRFAEEVSADLAQDVEPQVVAHYMSGGIRDSWFGLARYWRKRRPST